jgi:hypothetical protein
MSEEKQPKPPQFDDVLKRMLSSPPKQRKDERAKPKPAGEPAQKKPAK